MLEFLIYQQLWEHFIRKNEKTEKNYELSVLIRCWPKQLIFILKIFTSTNNCYLKKNILVFLSFPNKIVSIWYCAFRKLHMLYFVIHIFISFTLCVIIKQSEKSDSWFDQTWLYISWEYDWHNIVQTFQIALFFL